MNDKISTQPEFSFFTRITQVELLGVSARNIKELLFGIEKVPTKSIYHHTHRYLEQYTFFSPEHPNDFSYWVANSLGLKRLAEQIASIDIFQFADIDSLRKRIAEILREYAKGKLFVRNCIEGEEFRFLASRIFILPTNFVAGDLKEFAECLEKVSVHSMYYHIFESRMRLKKSDNDFSFWLRTIGHDDLAKKISRLDPYTQTSESLRKKIISIVKEAL